VGHLLALLLLAPLSWAGVQETSDQLLKQAAVNALGSQKAILSAVDPASNSCGSAEPAQVIEPEGGAGVYECQFSEVTPQPNPSVSPSPLPAVSQEPVSPEKAKALFSALPGSTLVEWSTANDNYPGHLKPKGDKRFDMGHTFDMKLSAARILAKDGKLGKRGDKVGVEVGTELYSQDSKLGWDTYNATMNAWSNSDMTGMPVVMADANGNPREVYISGVTYEKTKDKQQALSRNYAKVFKEWNREKFTVIGAVTVESRDSDGKNFGSKMQNGWHKMGGAKYTYNNDPARGSAGTTTLTPVGNHEGIDIVNVSVAPDVVENQSILEYGDWATSVSATAQKKVKFFEGRCQLIASVGTTLGVQGGSNLKSGSKIEFDPNSRVELGSELKGSLIRSKDKQRSLLTASMGGAVVYYPRSFGEKSAGVNANAGLQSDFLVSKNGDRFQTGLQFYAPGSTGIFQSLDDSDKIVQMTVRYVFVGKKKKK